MNNHGAGFVREDPWRILRIMGEFVECFELMSRLSPAVTVFGSARTRRRDPYYQAAVQLGKKLGRHKIPVITGGGPGIMEAANKGAALGGGTSVGLNIELPHEQGAMNSPTSRCIFTISFHGKSVLQNTVSLSFSCPAATAP